MSWFEKELSAEEKRLAEQVALEAEGLYRSGRLHCAESVLAGVRNRFAPQLPEEVVRLAGGFGGGSGAGCLCGAVAGGAMAFGLVLEGDRKEAAALTKELHRWFKEQYRVTCCKVLTAKGKGECASLTSATAGQVAELLIRRGKMPVRS